MEACEGNFGRRKDAEILTTIPLINFCVKHHLIQIDGWENVNTV